MLVGDAFHRDLKISMLGARGVGKTSMIAAMTSHVATGREMNGADGFMPSGAAAGVGLIRALH